MNQLLNDFLLALAQTTRFDFRDRLGDAATATPSAHRWMQVLLRALMGALYFFIFALLNALFSQPVAAKLLSAAAIAALHYWLTAGKEAQLPQLFQRAWLPNHVSEGPDALGLFLQCLPILLLLALLFLNGAVWLPAIFAIGAAGGRDLARPNAPSALSFDWAAWLAAFVVLFLSTICPYLCNDLLRGMATRSSLVVFAVSLLWIPWLRHLPHRPAGFLANSFLASAFTTLLVLFILCL